jgi:hypothetical protein
LPWVDGLRSISLRSPAAPRPIARRPASVIIIRTTSIGPGASFDYPAYKEAERPEDLASARAIKLFTESCGIACNQTKLLRSINVFA